MSDDQKPFEISRWRADAPEVLAETRIFTLLRRRATSPNDADRSGEFVVLDSADWVNVIALTDDEQVVLIEQFRHGIEEVTLEIPGGMVDPGEDPLSAGLRELREETGYGGGVAELIGVVAPNPALLNNCCHTVLVRGVAVEGAPELEGFEEIRTRLEPLAGVAELIRSGGITHALVIAAFHHLHLLDCR
jgi:8-oxo-dGTP pyrophosphatase MutT (NUDIX family)